MDYSKWDNFQSVISKAKTACELSGEDIFNHFAGVGKTIQMPKGAEKEIPNLRPEDDVNKVDRKLKSDDKKVLKNSDKLK